MQKDKSQNDRHNKEKTVQCFTTAEIMKHVKQLPCSLCIFAFIPVIMLKQFRDNFKRTFWILLSVFWMFVFCIENPSNWKNSNIIAQVANNYSTSVEFRVVSVWYWVSIQSCLTANRKRREDGQTLPEIWYNIQELSWLPLTKFWVKDLWVFQIFGKHKLDDCPLSWFWCLVQNVLVAGPVNEGISSNN